MTLGDLVIDWLRFWLHHGHINHAFRLHPLQPSLLFLSVEVELARQYLIEHLLSFLEEFRISFAVFR